MSYYRCGHCGVTTADSSHTELGYEPSSTIGTYYHWDVLACAACEDHTLRKTFRTTVIYFPPEGWERVRNIDKVPEQVADDYEEAVGCLISGHYKAAAAMARRAVQGTCVDLGAKPGATLYGQIDDLQAQGHITKRLAELAHKIRVLGNDAAHPGKDGLDIVTAEEAKQTVDFLEHMLQHVFILGA